MSHLLHARPEPTGSQRCANRGAPAHTSDEGFLRFWACLIEVVREAAAAPGDGALRRPGGTTAPPPSPPPLAAAGYRAFRCRPRDAADAHAVAKRARADLVILHRRLTERGDGWAFLRRLRADLDTTHLPAIVVAGEAGALPVAAELLRTMRCRVLREPIDAAAVRRAIAAALGRATTPRR